MDDPELLIIAILHGSLIVQRFSQKLLLDSIVCTTPFLLGGWTSNQIFKKGGAGLTGPQLLERVAGKEGWLFSWGWGCNFHIKNKLKSEIFNDKKVYKQKYFSLS